MKKYLVLFIFIILFLSGCSNSYNEGDIQKVGMLTEGKIHDHPWIEKGYEGLKTVEEKFNVEVVYKENIAPGEETSDVVEELVNDGVNLIFGHSSSYGKSFFEISKDYPDVHFVYFNGTYYNENVTSLNFNSHAMGFFAGMLASEMSETNEVGIIAAYQWQPEIEGFYEGVKYQDETTNIQMNFIYDWNDTSIALEMYEQMKDKNVDVFYPAGDAFSETIIQHASKDQLYAIGYVSDQLEIDPRTVLSSTVQRVNELYEIVAERFNKGELEGEIITFDFKDEVLSIGEFSPDVPESFKNEILEAVEEYKESGLLPNQ
ncbi:BMP family ABC transporter substrate-binding protein [Ornithinibacillus halophilus]|uniref:Nucleoside-binding protein n=1 Tax=Ornithinibacillus halophilus TaxID=930117 RepID=A0A1M5I489_9BACI|nr:BMP family ABC transporter substrate-binding protein [Ornithinibacillus halophilus]SHG23072.1 nucleoside-binding protein [Ornithinibacillus halophilus]